MNAKEACEALKKLDPASLKVTLTDGTDKPVAVPKIRNRWQRVVQVLDSLPWVRVEALDKSGAVLGAVEDEPEDGFDDQDDDAQEELPSGMVKMARVLVEVMRSTQKETRQMFEVQMRGQAELVAALIAGVRSISESYEMSMQVQRAAVVADAAKDSGGAPEVMAMLQLALSQLNRPAAPQVAGK